MCSVIFHDVEQNTDEWFAMRAGKLTGSNFGKIMANMGKSFGEPAKKLAMTIAAEQLSGSPISSNFSNAHMERGHEQEPVARMMYEDETFAEVDNGGFFDCGFVGVSPDGLMYKDGVLEIKSVLANVHFANIKRKTYDPAYKWQFIGNLFYTQREYIDFVSYCADFPEGKRLFVCTLQRDKLISEFEQLQKRVAEFKLLVNDYKTIINESKYQVIA